jgi:hypothetical protein
MNPIITDLTESKQNKKIELISCLQYKSGPQQLGCNSFYKSNYADTLEIAKKITRLAALSVGYNNLDLIMLDDTVYLGYWNDGVI